MMILAIKSMIAKGVQEKNIIFLNVVSCPEGIRRLNEEYPKGNGFKFSDCILTAACVRNFYLKPFKWKLSQVKLIHIWMSQNISFLVLVIMVIDFLVQSESWSKIPKSGFSEGWIAF